MEYKPLHIPRAVRISRLYSLYYFCFATGTIFAGEAHNFWEMVYVDQGEADLGADGHLVRLGKGQAIFHKPNEFHSIFANYADAPNLLVVSFDAPVAFMRPFRGWHGTVTAPARHTLGQMTEEAVRCFGPVLDRGSVHERLRDDAPTGSLQLIAGYLEQFLLHVARGLQDCDTSATAGIAPHEASPLMENAVTYMRAHVRDAVLLADIARACGCSATTLKDAFRRHSGTGVMTYFRRLRLEEARRMLRQGALNITETADALGYSDVHDFSRQFKRLMGISPSAYLRSIRM